MSGATLSSTTPPVAGRPPTEASPLVRAARGERPDHLPVWFMRQAGRSLPEYRTARGELPMLEACFRPDVVTEITLQPVRRYGVDAAIFYSDIVVPLRAVGVDVEIVPGTGPVLARPFTGRADLERIPELEPGHVPQITEAVRLLVAELGATPLIGFAGAPFTLASYLVEGGPSRDLRRTKALMYGDPELWSALTARLAQISAAFLRVQIEAGASAVQLFDSWVGNVSLPDYLRYVRPASATTLAAVRQGPDGGALPAVPRIHFGVGTGELLAAMGEAGAEVVGVDFRVPLDVAAARIGPGRAVQGNLDPAALFAPWPVIAERVRDLVDRGRAADGHIVNLGHGVPPEADPAVLARIVDLVHSLPVRPL